jgi:ParB/RepB/Spo0J family partition protein
MEGQIKLIKMDLIDRPVKIARETIDPEAVRELAESIREDGLKQAILLRPVNGRFEIVFGDRRFLAHKLLGKKEIKGVVEDLDDRQTAVIRGVENLQRVNLTPSEEARTYIDLKESGGLSEKEICKRTGKAPMTVRRYIRFGKCPAEVRRAVDLKQISLNTLEVLMEIDDADAFRYHFEMAAANGVTEKVARLWVDDFEKTKLGTYYSDDGSASLVNVSVEVRPAFLTCEVCHGPCEIHKARTMVVCPDCGKKVKHT